jgi:hypothetical protein
MLLVVPFFQGNRYLLPVVPFFILYIFHGVESLASLSSKRLVSIASAAILLLGITSHAGYIRVLEEKPAMQSVLDTEAVELYDHIKNKTPQDSIIIFNRPRILALFTRRQSATYSGDISICQSWENFQQLGATHLLVNTNEPEKYLKNLLHLINGANDKLKPAFQNNNFKLYRFNGDLMSGCKQ